MINQKKIIIVSICIFVGLLHFLFGPEYHGPFRNFVLGYLIDILLPFSLFLLLGLVRHPLMEKVFLRIVVVFAIGLIVESLQYFDINIFGNTADVFDLVAYAAGIAGAVIFEHFVLSKIKTPNS